MKLLLHVWFLCGTFNAIISFATRWTYDLLDMTTYSSNPDIVDLHFTIERIARGRFGYSGYMDFKDNMHDDVRVTATLQRSKDREGPYSMMPLNIDNETLTNTMNKFYKKMVMPSVAKCCENAPVFKDSFEAPLTKRRIDINKCELSSELSVCPVS